MTARTKAVAIPETEAVEALLRDVSEAQAPMVQRQQAHRDAMDIALKALEGERYDLANRREQLRRQYEAADSGLAMHLADIDATISMYVAALGSLPVEA